MRPGLTAGAFWGWGGGALVKDASEDAVTPWDLWRDAGRGGEGCWPGGEGRWWLCALNGGQHNRLGCKGSPWAEGGGQEPLSPWPGFAGDEQGGWLAMGQA